MINEVKQLNDFFIESDSIQIAERTVDNILPGKYLVLMHILNETNTHSKGNLYLVHENFADESIPLDEYRWQQGNGLYIEGDTPTLTIQNPHNSQLLGVKEIQDKLDNQMAGVIDNTVLLSMYYSDNSCFFNTLIEGNQIVGFRIDDIGSWSDIPTVQLDNFLVHSNTVNFDRDSVENVLPGQYLVWKKINKEDDVLREGNLYIIHENFIEKNISLENYKWIKGGSFDSGDGPVLINDMQTPTKLNYANLKNQFGDQMANVIDNTVCFSMPYSDFGYDFKVLKEGEQIVGFHVDGIGSWINTPNVQLGEACRTGDLQSVKKLLTETNAKNKAVLSYDAFYWACVNAHKDIIVYLMSSPDLEQHSKINNPDDNRFTTPFTILCHTKPEIVQELIMELPMEQLNDIKEFLNNPKNLAINKLVLLDTLSQRELKEIPKIDFIEQTKKIKPI